ncbi:hypothetical protein AWL63_24195 (plasmid) [Sphingomonas panacis]|uniref:Uncharacterized protein n=1 Tax=Sphingomonas panacis TaxID=1560345 RepID=A0A1B3ZIJ8_9SPHN|nr:hypothetical protein [Sphingomonas panacis]AOH87257.1 hypothetical protein AWL63_24195 [Sphingomonas panacis]
MPLWLDLLRTPMAAPETGSLRRLRLTWQGLCLATALAVGFFRPMRQALGQRAPILAAVLLLATAISTVIYVARKQRADKAYLETSGSAE